MRDTSRSGAAVREGLTALVRDLQGMETLNVCVQASIGGLAALADPVGFVGLIGEGREAAAKDDNTELKDLFTEVIEYVEGL
jgi:hypothetical protein